MKKLLLTLMLTATAASAHDAPAAADKSAAQLVLYTNAGRGSAEALADLFSKKSGLKVAVSYSPADFKTADVVWVGNAMQLQGEEADQWLPLSVDGSFVPTNRLYAPQTVRFRSLIYSRDRIKTDQLPKSIMDLPKVTALKGKVAWAVTSPSFTDLVAAMLAQHGEAATKTWLEGMKALEPRDFGNEISAFPNAIATEQADVALGFSQWVTRYRPAGYRIDNYFFADGDVGNTAEVSAIAVRKTTKERAGALALVNYLSQPEAQLYVYTGNFEQPLSTGTLTPRGMVAPEKLANLAPNIDLLPYRKAAEKLLIDLDIL